MTPVFLQRSKGRPISVGFLEFLGESLALVSSIIGWLKSGASVPQQMAISAWPLAIISMPWPIESRPAQQAEWSAIVRHRVARSFATALVIEAGPAS
jgi:hypothetical protein